MLRYAEEKDFENIIQFYDIAIDVNQASEFNIRWQKNVHPSHALILSSIHNKEMLVFEDGNELLGACVFNHMYHEDYHKISWGIDAKDDKIGVIHVFATSPNHFRKGIGTKMLRSIIEYAKDSGLKTIRLDAFKLNKPAIALYESVGFQCRGEMHMFVPNIGDELFVYYEYVL